MTIKTNHLQNLITLFLFENILCIPHDLLKYMSAYFVDVRQSSKTVLWCKGVTRGGY